MVFTDLTKCIEILHFIQTTSIYKMPDLQLQQTCADNQFQTYRYAHKKETVDSGMYLVFTDSTKCIEMLPSHKLRLRLDFPERVLKLYHRLQNWKECNPQERQLTVRSICPAT